MGPCRPLKSFRFSEVLITTSPTARLLAAEICNCHYRSLLTLLLAEGCIPRAAEKLRAQHCVAGAITVSTRSNPFKPWEAQYSQGAVARLYEPSADTRILIQAALWGLNKIYRSGYVHLQEGRRTVAGSGARDETPGKSAHR